MPTITLEELLARIEAVSPAAQCGECDELGNTDSHVDHFFNSVAQTEVKMQLLFTLVNKILNASETKTGDIVEILDGLLAR